MAGAPWSYQLVGINPPTLFQTRLALVNDGGGLLAAQRRGIYHCLHLPNSTSSYELIDYWASLTRWFVGVKTRNSISLLVGDPT